ncbi:MAG: UDP-N-acetylglucosamine 2-epimerase (non-hydrolyzing) [Cyclobacteriaceae bacterium]|nr:UDP-N-acetylglucosamine 2-epimerase (non-hydrolyzing) [Cyclobacteriaceae bacterium]
MRLTLVAGARPNFMKIAPIIHALENSSNDISYRLIHTGQHYDDNLSKSFFRDLNIPQPNVNLGVGSGSQALQTGNIMIKFEEELVNNPCDYVLVVGDVNSTVACALVAKKLNTKVIHVEAGLRSYDLRMPEEINRIATDALADVFFTTTPEAGYNLVAKGAAGDKIFFVGNTMIDSLISNLDRLERPKILDEREIANEQFLVMTLHRPSNVDEEKKLKEILELLDTSSQQPIIFPVHPRTRQILKNLQANLTNIVFTEPLRYLEFMYLIKHSLGVVTDSGGIQEETTYLGKPCMTLRENTERPETIELGTNVLLGFNKQHISEAFDKLQSGNWKTGTIPALWDGKASTRIVNHLEKLG